jgi:hypothetical protein
LRLVRTHVEALDAILGQPFRVLDQQIGLLWPTPRDRIAMRDLQAYFRGGIVEDALSAIRDRWRRHPLCRWNLDGYPRRDGRKRRSAGRFICAGDVPVPGVDRRFFHVPRILPAASIVFSSGMSQIALASSVTTATCRT